MTQKSTSTHEFHGQVFMSGSAPIQLEAVVLDDCAHDLILGINTLRSAKTQIELIPREPDQSVNDIMLTHGTKYNYYIKANDPHNDISRALDQSFIKRRGNEKKYAIMDVWRDLIGWADQTFAQFASLSDHKTSTHRSEVIFNLPRTYSTFANSTRHESKVLHSLNQLKAFRP